MVEAFRGLLFGPIFSRSRSIVNMNVNVSATNLTDVVDAATRISVLGGVQRGISTVTHNKKQRRAQRHCQMLDCMTTKTVFILHSKKTQYLKSTRTCENGTVYMCLTSVSG